MNLATPALADSQQYYSLWFVEPTAPATVEVQKGEFVVKTRLLPPGLIELTEDIVHPEKGYVLAHKGDQLFLASAGRPMKSQVGLDLGVYCTFRPEVLTSSGGLLPLFGKEQTVAYRCFVDNDRDGHLDALVGGSCTTKAFPIIAGKIPDQPLHVASGAYRKLTPQDIKDGPTIGVVFTGLRNSGAPNLALQFGDGEQLPTLGSASSGTKIDGQRAIMGAKISFVEGTGKTAKLRIDEGFPLQPFSMLATGCPKYTKYKD